MRDYVVNVRLFLIASFILDFTQQILETSMNQKIRSADIQKHQFFTMFFRNNML